MDDSKKPTNLTVLKPKRVRKKQVVTIRSGLQLPEILAPALSKSKVTKAGLCRFIEQIGIAYAPSMIQEFYKSLQAGVIRGDKDLMRMAGGMYGLVPDKAGNGVTINNLVNAQANASASADSDNHVDFNALARRLAERKIGPTITVSHSE